MNRRSLRCAGVALLLGMGAGAPALCQALIPLVECGDDLTLTDALGVPTLGRFAHFSYFNPTDAAISSAAGGSENFLSPGNPNQGQPSSFDPGYHRFAFMAAHRATRDLVWIRGTQFTLSRSGTLPCSDPAVPLLSPVPLRLAAGSTHLGIELMRLAWAARPAAPISHTATAEIWRGNTDAASTPTADVLISNLRVTENAVLGDVTVTATPSRSQYALTLKLANGTATIAAKSALLEVFSTCSLTVTPAALPAGVSQTAYGPVAFGANGATAPYAFELASGRLPNGMQLQNGILGGTPAETGAFAMVINVTSADRCLVQQPYTLTIGGPACAADVTNSVSRILGGFRQNLITGRWQQTVMLTNTSGAAIQGPVSIALQGLSSNATLYNSSGVTQCAAPAGRPYVRVNLSGGTWLSGQALTATLEFVNNTPGQAITYTPRILAGGLSQ